MQLRIFLQISEYNFETNEYAKNISLPSQYSMSFLGEDAEVLYIIVSIKLHIGNDMDKDHYICDVLDCNIGTWWNCDDDTITQYPGYSMYVYDNLSIDKK